MVRFIIYIVVVLALLMSSWLDLAGGRLLSESDQQTMLVPPTRSPAVVHSKLLIGLTALIPVGFVVICCFCPGSDDGPARITNGIPRDIPISIPEEVVETITLPILTNSSRINYKDRLKDQCVVCLVSMEYPESDDESNSEINIMPCGSHLLHKSCSEKWVIAQAIRRVPIKCPICKQIAPGKTSNEDEPAQTSSPTE